MRQSKQILVVDDERSIRMAFKAIFKAEGFSVRTARNGCEALESFRKCAPDLVLMDVMMPKMNGLAACREIRSFNGIVPILFFTAMPTDVSMIRAFGFGADDYISKDRSPEEFLARVKAALRRSEMVDAPPPGPAGLTIGRASLDFSLMKGECDGVEFDLTRSEVLLLKFLARTPGKYFTVDEIFAELRGEDYIGDDSAVRSAIYRLKRKLGSMSGAICSSRGSGYALKDVKAGSARRQKRS